MWDEKITPKPLQGFFFVRDKKAKEEKKHKIVQIVAPKEDDPLPDLYTAVIHEVELVNTKAIEFFPFVNKEDLLKILEFDPKDLAALESL